MTRHTYIPVPAWKARGLRDALRDVARFHKAASIPECSGPPALTRRKLRHRLLREEFQEYQDAMLDNDRVGVADALADMVFVALGTALMQFGGERFARVWDEVVRSNMTKVGDSGKIEVREDGKILKPDSYEAPRIAQILAGALPAPGAVPVSGGIDDGTMWEEIAIPPGADPKAVASILVDSFDLPWLHCLMTEVTNLLLQPKEPGTDE